MAADRNWVAPQLRRVARALVVATGAVAAIGGMIGPAAASGTITTFP